MEGLNETHKKLSELQHIEIEIHGDPTTIKNDCTAVPNTGY